MKYRKSLLVAVMAAAMQLPIAARAADAPAMPAMDGWSKGMGDWMTAMTNPQMMNSMMGMIDPKVWTPWITAMTDPKMMTAMMQMADPKVWTPWINASGCWTWASPAWT